MADQISPFQHQQRLLQLTAAQQLQDAEAYLLAFSPGSSAYTIMASSTSDVGWSQTQTVTHPKTGKRLVPGEFYVSIADHNHRLHSVNGAPARKWSDGYEEFCWHGVTVPELVVRAPEKITVAMIEAEDNAEVRLVMIERYGEKRYLADCGAVLLHKDKSGELYKKNLGQHEEPIVFVKVRNSTVEPDGSFKDYFLRVPPRIKVAKEAVAWSFNVPSKDYAPSVET